MDQRFRRLGRLSLFFSVFGYIVSVGILLSYRSLSESVGFAVFGIWLVCSVGAILCSVRFRRLYGKEKNKNVFVGMLLACVLLWVQVCFLCILLFDGQNWSNAESTALIMLLAPTGIVVLCIALYVTARIRGQIRAELARDRLLGVSADVFPDCIALLSVRKAEWRTETVGVYKTDGIFSLREAVRYHNSGEVKVEKQIDLPAGYAKKHRKRAFSKLLSATFFTYSFDSTSVASAYYRMK